MNWAQGISIHTSNANPKQNSIIHEKSVFTEKLRCDLHHTKSPRYQNPKLEIEKNSNKSNNAKS